MRVPRTAEIGSLGLATTMEVNDRAFRERRGSEKPGGIRRGFRATDIYGPFNPRKGFRLDAPAGLLALGSSRSCAFPPQWAVAILQDQSPTTAAGPQRLQTVFPMPPALYSAGNNRASSCGLRRYEQNRRMSSDRSLHVGIVRIGPNAIVPVPADQQVARLHVFAEETELVVDIGPGGSAILPSMIVERPRRPRSSRGWAAMRFVERLL